MSCVCSILATHPNRLQYAWSKKCNISKIFMPTYIVACLKFPCDCVISLNTSVSLSIINNFWTNWRKPELPNLWICVSLTKSPFLWDNYTYMCMYVCNRLIVSPDSRRRWATDGCMLAGFLLLSYENLSLRSTDKN